MKRMQISGWQATLLALMRIAIGWHFAYEGLVKVLDPQWTSAGYLKSAGWIGADAFHWMASDPSVLKTVDALNAWGLLLIGAGLMLGCLTRLAAVAGMVLLALYYVAQPPLFAGPSGANEGSYLIVNKNLVELLALCVVAVVPATRLGIDGLVAGLWRLFRGRRKTPQPSAAEAGLAASSPLGRRQMLATLVGLPFVGGLTLAVLKKRGYRSEEEKQLAARIDAVSSPSIKSFTFETLDDLKEPVPTAKIMDVELSRLIMGGNLMNGFAHARDLIYISKLIKAYHHPWKVYETFRLAENCGINTIVTNPILAPRIVEYWEQGLGEIQFIAQCKGDTLEALLDNVKYSLDNNACAAYVQGAVGDRYVREGKFDWIAKALELMRDAGIPAGIGGHAIQTIRGCVEQGFQPDFWMKTLHHHKYWSARKEDQHDNMWCEDPEDTIAFMESLPQPWIGFKVLAAGSVEPRDGFRYAFENGADFLCVGMYDFQVVEDVNVAVSVLGDKLERRRPWRA
ncbi:MAG: DoxX family protein [Pirellulales bacterium]|nr:DoxX family protein [Pirellulales bacterium]